MHARNTLPPFWVLGAALLFAGCASRPLAPPSVATTRSLPSPRVITQVRVEPPPAVVLARREDAPRQAIRAVADQPVRVKKVAPLPQPTAFMACSRPAPMVDFGSCAGGT